MHSSYMTGGRLVSLLHFEFEFGFDPFLCSGRFEFHLKLVDEHLVGRGFCANAELQLGRDGKLHWDVGVTSKSKKNTDNEANRKNRKNWITRSRRGIEDRK